jgi:hypothetical protein
MVVVLDCPQQMSLQEKKKKAGWFILISSIMMIRAIKHLSFNSGMCETLQ